MITSDQSYFHRLFELSMELRLISLHWSNENIIEFDECSKNYYIYNDKILVGFSKVLYNTWKLLSMKLWKDTTKAKIIFTFK
jgi:hypothetical protein